LSKRIAFTIAAIALLLMLPAASIAQQTAPRIQPETAPSYGGNHEFGGIVGYSPFSGPVWGYDQNVRYLPVILRYSYLLTRHRNWSLRYAPELTALSVMYERAPSTTNPAAPVYHFGSGFTPEGFQLDYLPRRKAQPFLSNNAGFIYYADRVLSPQGSQWMYTIDFGAGVNIFVKPHDALTFGYRYQHLSNANISVHNPGTDADTFYIGFSHFHTHGVR
jgi:opacity protein-like surface antigen